MVMPDCSLVVTIFSRHSGPLQRTATRVTSMATFANEEHPVPQLMQGSCQPCCALCTSACSSAWPSRFFKVCHATARSSARPNQSRHRPLTTSPNRHVLGELRSKLAVINRPIEDTRGDPELAYKMIAERDNETVKIERTSSFVIVAKARIWASEGWQVVITDADGKSYELAEFDQLLAA